jgi:hypothetical protein
LKIQIPLRSIFETPTIAGIARYIEAISGANQDLQMTVTETIASQNREEVEF